MALSRLSLIPGCVGAFGTTIPVVLARFGVGAKAATPISGYRLFGLWLPAPLTAVFYPTSRLNGGWFE